MKVETLPDVILNSLGCVCVGGVVIGLFFFFNFFGEIVSNLLKSSRNSTKNTHSPVILARFY